MQNRVIVTAISPNMWHDYLVFYDSIRRHHDYPIYIVCLEMVDWQLDALKNHKNVHIVSVSQDLIDTYKATNKYWRQWFKPYYFDMIPKHKTVLWLDADIVVLETLDPIFEIAETKFVVMSDYFAPKTCSNKHELYQKFKLEIPKEKTHIVLNSGVIGLQPERKQDRQIIKLWKRKINIAVKNDEISSLISLFDQGALLWTLQELNYYNLIIPRKTWNHPAKKNPYELVGESITNGMVETWPQHNSIKPPVDSIESIRIDNPGATIAHFAGLPKLTHLCEPNHQYSLTHFRRKNGGKETRRTFIVGLERAGIQNLAAVLRRSCVSENWVRHGLTPTLAPEVQAKHFGEDYKTHELLERFDLYARRDCGFVCEANKNLAYFINDIDERLQGTARFVIVLRDPVSIIRSRFMNFVTWPDLMHKAPAFYRDDYRKFMGLGVDTSNNYFRIKPHKETNLDLIDLHIWEIEHQLRTIAASLKNIQPYSYRYVWIENMRGELFNLAQFIGGQRIDPVMAEKTARLKHKTGLKICSNESTDWIEAQLEERMVEIYRRFSAVVTVPYRGV